MNIRDTTVDALQKQGVAPNGAYQGYVDHVVNALEVRESEIASNLLSYATEQGLDRETARRALADCGLDFQSGGVDGEDPRLSAIETALSEMQAALRDLRG